MMKKSASEVIKKLMLMGVMATLNQELDFDTAALIASEFGITGGTGNGMFSPNRTVTRAMLVVMLSRMHQNMDGNAVIDGAVDVQKKSPLQLFGELYQLQNNQPMSDLQQNFLQELIESIWEVGK